ncbi:MAG: transcriptional repressor [Opitutales bacterium]|nr:transcriptional repressor [Opitutales bacterium]MCH8541504.1 transcriptional repressor [Opitutales bacterium]
MTKRKTKQREVILEVLTQASRPLTRTELHQETLARLPGIGFATVSRAVNDLLAQQELVHLQYPGQPNRYEIAADIEHPHILCIRCQKIFDLPEGMPELSLPKVKGFKVGGYEVLYFGECTKRKTCPHHPATEAKNS